MSSEKSFETSEVDHINEMNAVGQAFINTIYRGNGKAPPDSPAHFRAPSQASEAGDANLKLAEACLNLLDPDMPHDQWKQVGMGLSHESGNSDAGYQLFDSWSSRGTKYRGHRETQAVWRSLANPPDNPITIATLVHLVKEAGHDVEALVNTRTSPFEKVEFTVVYADDVSVPQASTAAGPSLLTRHSLTGASEELEKRQQAEVSVLADIALLGQATAIYAAPNCGKTLGVISMLSDAIEEGRIQADRVVYMNADDHLAGLTEKVRIAEKYGFHMIGDGYRDFRAPMLFPILEAMIENETAAGVILVLDTAKRFTDLMNKKETREFTSLVRRFVTKGGTVIALAHVNKKKTDSGKSVYAGTSDVIDDFDCAYVIELIDDGNDTGKRVIAFENRKARGNVARLAHFSYLVPDSVSDYSELLESFCRIDDEVADQAAQEAQRKADAPLIEIVSSAILEGPAAKKDLIAVLRKKAQISRNSAAGLVERYCGDIPGKHLWTFERGERGVHRYRLLNSTLLGGKS